MMQLEPLIWACVEILSEYCSIHGQIPLYTLVAEKAGADIERGQGSPLRP
jgi:hypothetical protein